MKLFTALTLSSFLVGHAALAKPKAILPKGSIPKKVAPKKVTPKAAAPKATITKAIVSRERHWMPQFASYLGGSRSDEATAIAVDGAGNFYVAGFTNSPNFPGAQKSPDLNRGDGFLCKFSPSYQLLWTRLIGGNGLDHVQGLTLDKKGDVYVIGSSEDGDIPILNAPKLIHGSSCAFVARYDSKGELLMTTLLGGSGWANGEAIAVNEAGEIWIAGTTRGAFPAKDMKLYLPAVGKNDVWVAKLASSGEVLFSTLLGGGEDESLGALTLAPNGGLALTGTTASPNFPVVNATQTIFGGAGSNMNGSDVKGDAWVCVLDADGKTRWSTFYGGRSADIGEAVAFAPNGDLWLTGSSASRDLPLKQILPGGDGLDGPFLARFSGDGSQLLQSTFVPRLPRNCHLLNVGSKGDLWLGSDSDSYISSCQFTHLDPDASKVVETISWATDKVRGWAQGANGALYLTGTASSRVPVRRALLAIPSGEYEAFVAVLQLQAANMPNAKPAAITVDAPAKNLPVKGLLATGTTSVGNEGEVQVMLYRSADSTYWNGTDWKNAPNWLSARITGMRWKLEGLPQGANLPSGDYYLHAVAVAGDQFENFIGAEYSGPGRAKASQKIVVAP